MTEKTTPDWTRLGLIAGGGDLPVEILRGLEGEAPFVVSLKGMVDRDFGDVDGVSLSMGEIGGAIKAFRKAGCDAVCFAGYATRPDFKSLRMDARGLAMLPRVLAAAKSGDDALLRVVIGEFERDGFRVLGADEVLAHLTPEAGLFGAETLTGEQEADAAKAMHVAAEIGRLDIGQGAVVAHGVVLAVEAQEGTNAMLERAGSLPRELRGPEGERCGVLAKCPKPIQERRIDLPTIGVDTVKRCDAAGLAGIVLEAGGALIVNRPAVLDALERAGLFLLVRAPETPAITGPEAA